jgi:hypothetical protein
MQLGNNRFIKTNFNKQYEESSCKALYLSSWYLGHQYTASGEKQSNIRSLLKDRGYPESNESLIWLSQSWYIENIANLRITATKYNPSASWWTESLYRNCNPQGYPQISEKDRIVDVSSSCHTTWHSICNLRAIPIPHRSQSRTPEGSRPSTPISRANSILTSAAGGWRQLHPVQWCILCRQQGSKEFSGIYYSTIRRYCRLESKQASHCDNIYNRSRAFSIVSNIKRRDVRREASEGFADSPVWPSCPYSSWQLVNDSIV